MLMSIFIKSIERRLYFVSLWSFDISVFFCIFTYCISFTHCQINRYENKKITPLMTLVEWAVLCTKFLPPSFQRSTSESSSSSALFVSLLYQKQNELQISVIPRLRLQSKICNSISLSTYCKHRQFCLIKTQAFLS